MIFLFNPAHPIILKILIQTIFGWSAIKVQRTLNLKIKRIKNKQTFE